MTMHEAKMLIGGEELTGDSTVELCEPYHGEPNLRVHVASADQADRAVAAAARAFLTFGREPAHVRSAILSRVAKEVAASKPAFVEALIAATGKTRKDASGEVDRSLETLSISSEEALRIEGFEVPMDASPR